MSQALDGALQRLVKKAIETAQNEEGSDYTGWDPYDVAVDLCICCDEFEGYEPEQLSPYVVDWQNTQKGVSSEQPG